MNDKLLSPQEAQRKMGITAKSTFWDIVTAKKVKRVEYTAKCIRFPESAIDELIAKHTVDSAAARARLADGRRS